VHGWIFNENDYVAACMEVKDCVSFWWLVETAPQSPNRDGSGGSLNLFLGAPMYYQPPIPTKQLKAI